ncbi:MAG: TetR/AcrR family transcriptional regulator [Pseudomonadota bacterium]|uniref:TetR/AcrR family transcriptional regulator n=1 Tax=Sphingomonas sp. ERG5 TaxID=1381597 RepID=UPI00054BE583|nr:TetR/AcrR family transcriptional regulator [Sphingomonas sp. ERG5]
MTQTATKIRPPRRPQAERSADTRAKLIEAAIICLHRFGYSATTVTIVAEEAGVSRGAMTHQFPAKTDLMLAVVGAVYEADTEHYRRALTALSPAQWMKTLPATMWEAISCPSGVAVMEIMLASRSDDDLAVKLRALQSDIDLHAHAAVVDRHAQLGLVEREDGEAVHRVFVGAVRGLTLEALFMDNRAEVEKSIAVLSEMLGLLYPKLLE